MVDNFALRYFLLTKTNQWLLHCDVVHFLHREGSWSIWYSAWRMADCDTHEWYASLLA